MAKHHKRAAWQRNIIHVAWVVLIIAVIQILLPDAATSGVPDAVTIGPNWLIPAIEIVGAPAVLYLLGATGTPSRRLRVASIAYLVFLVFASVLNASLLFITMLRGGVSNGRDLLFAGFGVLIINVLSFGVIYWFMDGGGPEIRHKGHVKNWDFQFPQQASDMKWTPELPDYLYTAYTNIIAFSPTDTMPLTHRAKLLFTIQSAVSLVTITVVLSAAINLINIR